MSISIEQRLNDPQVALQLALDATVAGLWTALPGIVQSFNASAVTAKIQPAIQGVVIQPDGTRKAVNLPLLLDVPVVFPRGGGATLTFPVKGGDECLVVFASRCIDAWWQSGGIQLPMEMRKHGCNSLADSGRFAAITRAINGQPPCAGNNGPLRQSRFEAAQKVSVA